MNALARLCPADDILLDVAATERSTLFALAANHLRQRYGLLADAIATKLAEREQLGSTGLGQGMALPHARIPELATPLALILRTAQPIPFNAPDGKPVDTFLTLLVPAHAHQEHLALLADAAQLCCQRSFRTALRQAPTNLAVRRLLLEASA